MNFKRGSTREEPEMNLIPFIDVLLVILIFLMVTTTYSKYTGMEINLPTADAGQQSEQPNEINIAVAATGEVVLNNNNLGFIQVAELSNQLQATAATMANKSPLLIISADAKATHQSVIDVMQAAQQANLPHISFSTQQRPAQ